nr:lysidine synthase [Cystoclonium purpureum f. stellatum]
MTTYLHRKFYHKINKFLINHSTNAILIAISGGQDSLCLIKLVEDFNKRYNLILKITYIYIDHQWKKDSQKQINHLTNIIKTTNQNIIIYQIKNIFKSEIKARQTRYQILLKHALKYKYSSIITAHTKTDKAETFIQQIIRGTSLNGITSFNEQRKLHKNLYMQRPLLDFTRYEINWFCRKFKLPIWSDITNYEYKIPRNRLRNELIPYINRYFTTNIEAKINNFLNISNLENEYIKQNAIKLYLQSRHEINIALNYKLIHKQHIALQKRTLQIFFS